MSSAPRVSLYDVARAAGVSHMTVSRVVRSDPRVAAPTRSRVRETIERLGYRPDPALSALAAYRRLSGGAPGSVVAFLLCDADSFAARVYSGARTEAERLGYRCESHSLSRHARSQKQLCRVLMHRGIRGLLFGPSEQPWTFSGWNWEHFAAISLGALSHHPAMNGVAFDYFDAAFRAAAYLRARGCERVGLAVSPALEARTGHRWLGAYTAWRYPEPPMVYTGLPNHKAALLHWARRHKIDGLLTIHRIAWETLSAKKIPTVFLNNLECPPEVPHIDVSPESIGQSGMRTIHHQVMNHEFGLPGEIKLTGIQGRLVECLS